MGNNSVVVVTIGPHHKVKNITNHSAYGWCSSGSELITRGFDLLTEFSHGSSKGT